MSPPSGVRGAARSRVPAPLMCDSLFERSARSPSWRMCLPPTGAGVFQQPTPAALLESGDLLRTPVESPAESHQIETQTNHPQHGKPLPPMQGDPSKTGIRSPCRALSVPNLVSDRRRFSTGREALSRWRPVFGPPQGVPRIVSPRSLKHPNQSSVKLHRNQARQSTVLSDDDVAISTDANRAVNGGERPAI
jgi:hypothetical protein